MTDPVETPLPAEGGEDDSNYLIISLAVGIPCGVIIVGLFLAIFLLLYLTCKTSSYGEEVDYRHRRFQGLSLEQQRQSSSRANRRRKKQVTQRRESGVSGTFNMMVPSRRPSNSAATATPNPFGMQEWQLRMYGGAGLGVAVGRKRGGGGESPLETEETELSGDERSRELTGAINPLMVTQGDDHDPGYDTPPSRKHTIHHHQPPHSHPSPGSHTHRESSNNEDMSSDDSMNPYD